MTGLLLVGLAPFVVMGFVLGYVVPVDSMPPAMGGLIVLFALFRGRVGKFLQQRGHAHGGQAAPLVLGRTGREGRRGERQLAGRGMGCSRRLDCGPGPRSGARIPAQHQPELRTSMAIRWENVGRGMAVASQEEANWVAAQRAWGRGWRLLVLPVLFLAYLVYVGQGVAHYSHGAGAAIGFAVLAVFVACYLAIMWRSSGPDVSSFSTSWVFWALYAGMVASFVAEVPFARVAAFAMCLLHHGRHSARVSVPGQRLSSSC